MQVFENHNVATESLVESVFVDHLLNLSDYEVNSSLAECVSGVQLPLVYNEEQSQADNETTCPLEWTSSIVEQCEPVEVSFSFLFFHCMFHCGDNKQMLVETIVEPPHLSDPVSIDLVSVTVYSLTIANFVNESFKMDTQMATTPPQFLTSTEPLSGLEINLLSNVTQISIHTLPRLATICDAEFYHNAIPQLISGFEYSLNANFSQAPDSRYLASLRHFRLFIRELILHSLPIHWSDWIIHNVSYFLAM